MSWQTQNVHSPLFPGLMWSKPETIHGAGKLLILGGQAQEFAHVAAVYSEAERAGIGIIRVVVPDSLAKVTRHIPNIEYAASNPSGSFARAALNEVLDSGQWADGIVLAGDFGKNSETSLLLETLIAKYSGPLVVSSEALESITAPAIELLSGQKRFVALTLLQLQKIGVELSLPFAITSDIGRPGLAEALEEMTKKFSAYLVVTSSSDVWTAGKGNVINTPKTRAEIGAIATWIIQNPNKPLEAITTALCS